jgi:thioredoxin-dependent peroxiredoxin
MRLTAPSEGVDFVAHDIYGKPIALRDFRGRRVMLSFFRNAGCPFCNFRIYELTHKYKDWAYQGLEIVAFFASTPEEVKRYVAKYPRPFRMIGDINLNIYNRYGVERSAVAIFKALLFKLPRVIRGMTLGNLAKTNAHPTLVPADFLVDEDGMIRDIWYGRDLSDHIPLKRVEAFIRQGVKRSRRASAA